VSGGSVASRPDVLELERDHGDARAEVLDRVEVLVGSPISW